MPPTLLFAFALFLTLTACSPPPDHRTRRLPKTSRKASSGSPGHPAAEGQVIGITDGDTLRLMRGGQPVRIRLSGIDAPEKSQPYGQAARQGLSDAVFGKVVRLEEHGTDRYGRTLADVFVAGSWVNLRMVRSGLAWRYVAYSGDQRLIAAEAAARSEHIGLWAGRSPIPPWLWRRK